MKCFSSFGLNYSGVMPLTDNENDQLLMRYLLGSLPAGDAEHLDELSITDDEFASRLSAAENDLVDAYVRKELPAETIEQFRSAYLSSPKRREKVRFAEALLLLQQKAAMAATAVRTDSAQVQKPERGWRFFTLPSLTMQWRFAAAAILVFVACSYLAIMNRRLRNEVNRVETERASLQERAQQLQEQLESQPAANAGASGTVHRHGPQPLPDQPRIAAFVLIPELRGSGLPPVSVARDIDLIVLKLELETSDFSKYRVALQESATRKILWRSGDLEPVFDGDKKAVCLAFRAGLVKPQNYVVQLNGVRANGTSELLSSYPFRVMLK
jgi:hypothetical protein